MGSRKNSEPSESRNNLFKISNKQLGQMNEQRTPTQTNHDGKYFIPQSFVLKSKKSKQKVQTNPASNYISYQVDNTNY